jgi:hypothetical protein
LKCFDKVIAEEPNFCEVALYRKAKIIFQKGKSSGEKRKSF